MDTFCTAMNKSLYLNEKGLPSYHINHMDENGDIGLVALDSQIIGKRGSNSSSGKGGKGGKGSKGGKGGVYLNNTKCETTDTNLYNLYDNIVNKINNISNMDKKKEYTGYLVKLLFKIRDIHEGNGERDIFYKLLLRLYSTQPSIVEYSLIFLVGGYDFNNDNEKFKDAPPGSFLDLNNLYKMCYQNNSNNIYDNLMEFILDLYKNTLLLDNCSELVDYPTLASKWAPRENSSLNKTCKMAHKLTNKLCNNYTVNSHKLRAYRNLLNNVSQKLNILEKYMCANDWDGIEVKNIPSKALIKYIKALKYINKDGTIRTPSKEDRLRLRDRILEELDKCTTDPTNSRINVATLMPYELVSPFINNYYYNDTSTKEDASSYNLLWDKYVSDFKKNMSGSIKPGLCIADVSGSMFGLPLQACLSLSLLLSEIIEGPLKNKVITFTEEPTWHEIKGNNLEEKVKNMCSAEWGQSTNFGKVLDLILNTAIQNKLKSSELPEVLYVFSDMQWDAAAGSSGITHNNNNNNYNYYYQPSKKPDMFLTGFELIEKKYNDAGYTMPHIVFWNLKGTDNFNNKSDQKGTTMMSGFSSNMFKLFLEGVFKPENTPWDTLKDKLETDRYSYLDSVIDKHYK